MPPLVSKPLRVAIVSGIYPPDVGGPATHAADLATELRARGHGALVVTLRDGPGVAQRDGVVRFPRRWPWPVRTAAVISWLVRRRSGYDVVYATGMQEAAVAGARLAGRPVVVKVVGDAAWERGRRLGLTELSFEGFQAEHRVHARVRRMRRLQERWLRRASAITAPSGYLARVIEGWLGGPAGVEVIPNGVRVVDGVPRVAGDGDLLVVFVGRLVSHKRVERLLAAVEATDGARLDVIGDGPERAALEEEAARLGVAARTSFLGDLPHAEAMRRIAAADALVLASDYEGLPHVVIESLAHGTPVVSPAVGGVGEVVADGENGIVLGDAGVATIAGALERLRDDPALRDRLAEGARRAGEAWRFERTADRLLALFERVIERPSPRIVLVGKARVPASPSLRRKVGALVRHADPVLVNTGPAGVRAIGRARAVVFPDGRPRAVWSALFYGIAPALAVARAAGRRPGAVVCQSPFEGVGAVVASRFVPGPWRPRVVVEVHGDWRASTRLYGGAARRGLAAPAASLATWALRRADRVRAIGAFTEDLARAAGYAGPIDRYPTFVDLATFLGLPAPYPSEPVVAFLGGAAPAKGGDVLLAAWPRVVRTVPAARLEMTGRWRELPDRARSLGALSADGVRELLDRSAVLVVPSRSEGLGRVALEAHARARPVVASRVGGLVEVVRDGVDGVLVPAEDPEALASAIATLLADRDRAVRMGEEGRRAVEGRDTAAEWDEGVARLAEWTREGSR